MNKATTQYSKRKALGQIAAAALSVGALVYPFIEQLQRPSPVPAKTGISDIPRFAKYDNVVDKKKAFFSYLLPEIERQNALIEQQRHWIVSLKLLLESGQGLNNADIAKLDSIAKEYRYKAQGWNGKSLEQLLIHVDVIPAPLILVQAANESAWGTSRFAQQGYNFFGLWCFSKGCGFVPRHRNAGAGHEVAKFEDLPHAVQTYLTNLNRHYAYEELRLIRARLRKNQQPVRAEALVDGLIRYSERGQAYVDELLEMLRVNRKYMI